MQTIFKVKTNPSSRDPEEGYQQTKLDIMLELGAKVIHVTPILDINTHYSSTYTDSLSYVIEEPETEEYNKSKEEKFKEIQERIEYLNRHKW